MQLTLMKVQIKIERPLQQSKVNLKILATTPNHSLSAR